MTIQVNGAIIPESAVQFELDRLVKFYSEHLPPEKIKEQMDALKKKARDQAIGAKLLMLESLKLDLPVSDAEVEGSLAKMRENAGGEEAFARLLDRQNLTEDVLRTSIRQGRKVDQLVARITEGLSDPTEAEIQAHYEQHRAEYAAPDRAQARHILIRPASESEADRAVARARLMEIREQIEEGADFADLAAAHSECPSGKKTGGSLGWFGRGMMLPEFDQAVFAMAVGELSEVIETPVGLHLIGKLAEEAGGPAAYEDVREKIRDFLRHVARGEAIAAYVNELKQNAVVDVSDD